MTTNSQLNDIQVYPNTFQYVDQEDIRTISTLKKK